MIISIEWLFIKFVLQQFKTFFSTHCILNFFLKFKSKMNYMGKNLMGNPTKNLDKYFHLSNQDGNIGKKRVINQPTISRYGLHGKQKLWELISQ